MNPHAYLKDEKQIEAVESIKRVDEKGYLYEMKAEYDWYDLPYAFKQVIDTGCSTFVTKNREGEVLFCRNYDYSHFYLNQRSNPRTGINVIVKGNNPKAKYKSLSVADAFWLDFKNGIYIEGVADDGKSDVSPFILCPMICMDGMNEEGLAISILALGVKADWNETDYEGYEGKLNQNKTNFFLENSGEVPDPYWLSASVGSMAVNHADQKAWIASSEQPQTKEPGKPTLLHPILMRMVLDNCASVKEAIAYMSDFNVKSAIAGSDFHIMLADKSGDHKLVEWPDGHMECVDIDHATNHYVTKEDLFFKDGCGRDEILKAGLFRTRGVGMSQDYAADVLKLAVQDPQNGIDRGKTQYSAIYNLEKKTMRIYSFGDMSKYWDYQL